MKTHAVQISDILNAVFRQHAPAFVNRVKIIFGRPHGPHHIAEAACSVPTGAGSFRVDLELYVDLASWKALSPKARRNVILHEAAHFMAYYEWLTTGMRGSYAGAGHDARWHRWAKLLGVDTSVGLPP